MVVGAILAGLASVTLIAVDLLLRRRGLRTPPVGWRAWSSSSAALLGAMASWEVMRPGDFDGAAFWFALVVPVLGSALTLRLALGRRP
jgi:hypothetical protein